MADNGLWFKLWCSANIDQDLDNLDIADFGRWCKLGAYIKAHGTHGMIRFEPPQRSLCSQLQVRDFNELLLALKRLPKVALGEEGKNANKGVTDATVTYTASFNNWKKYQEDTAWLRMRKKREKERNRVTPQRRGEEKRTDEKINKEEGFAHFWREYPKKKSKGDAEKAWKVLHADEALEKLIIEGVQRACRSADWLKDGGKWIPYPATYLRAKGWEDEGVVFKPKRPVAQKRESEQAPPMSEEEAEKNRKLLADLAEKLAKSKEFR